MGQQVSLFFRDIDILIIEFYFLITNTQFQSGIAI